MGQEESSLTVPDTTPPQTLTARSLPAIASRIKSGSIRRIVIMAGAGISTSAGIPDFRSPDTGLYANLARLNLPFAEAVFDIGFFRQNPLPFYTLAKELYPGRYRPTITHSFFKLLHDKGLLLTVFTQNIDCLEREAGLPGDKIIEAHGSFAKQSCIDCKVGFPDDEMKKYVEKGHVPKCKSCGGLVKPEIVFFGEQLPSVFHANWSVPATADLCIVLGTSLTVQPFAGLPSLCSEGVPRLLINKERVGGLGSRPDDVLLLGDCDEGVRRLARACGWEEELEALWASTAPTAAAELGRGEDKARKREENLDEEIEKLTREVEQTLDLSKKHADKVREETSGKHNDNDGKATTPTKPPRPTDGGPETLHYETTSGDSKLGHVFPHLKKPAL